MLEADIERIVIEYARQFPDDVDAVEKLHSLLEIKANVTSRKEFRGHVTCGAVVISQQAKLLMIHHRTLDKWLFPGGHLESGDVSLRDAALREITEETGISANLLKAPSDEFAHLPIHLDCHTIPANPAKQEPEHSHFDFRFAFVGSPEQIQLQAEEVRDWAWVDMERAPKPVYDRLVRIGLA